MTGHKDLIELPKIALTTIALEIWRLWNTIEKMGADSNTVTLRYSVRKMKQVMESQGFSFIDLTGEVYDAGMAVNVIDTGGEETEMAADLIIKEMMSPVILFRNKLLTHGQVILENKARNENMEKEDER